ncbi:UbiA family prenyltransferase [Limoniibacter endophyticus]|nr:UbiA family prenyltransferase [Limoniibacter endophyticus]
MNVHVEDQSVPLAVDLDGTLIASDLLWEGVFSLLRKYPYLLFMLPFWLLAGPARLKCEIATRIDIDPALLPYREQVLERLHQEKAKGRKIILATGTPRKFAEAIAQYLGIFDEVLATEANHNMTSHRKLKALVDLYGEYGFDYAGNSVHDIQVFKGARRNIIVAPDRPARRWYVRNGGELIGAQRPNFKTIVKMVRAHQWSKNVLIAVPIVLSHAYANESMVLACILAFISFSAAASAIYILNDFFDLALDRQHPTKRDRPFASGVLSMRFGLACAFCLLAISFAITVFLPVEYAFVLVLYLIMTTAYSFSIKRMLLIDVLTLAGLYTVRILAGAAASQVDISFWLLAFSIFFFLSLALVKRYVELRSVTLDPKLRMAGRGYRPEDQEVIMQAGMASAFAATLVLALYIDSADVRNLYDDPWMVWPVAPIILYITMRIWILARRDEMYDDPVVFLLRDWRSQAVIAIGAVLVIIAKFV